MISKICRITLYNKKVENQHNFYHSLIKNMRSLKINKNKILQLNDEKLIKLLTKFLYVEIYCNILGISLLQGLSMQLHNMIIYCTINFNLKL